MCRYKYVHREELSSSGVASLLGTTLFNRRFFLRVFEVRCSGICAESHNSDSGQLCGEAESHRSLCGFGEGGGVEFVKGSVHSGDGGKG